MTKHTDEPLAYYDYIYNGRPRESEYQLQLVRNKYSNGDVIAPEKMVLFYHFCDMLIHNRDPLFDEVKFLDYHYNKCELPKADFLKETRNRYLEVIDGIIKRNGSLSLLETESHATIMNWFDSKKEKSTDTADTSNLKAESFEGIFKSNDWKKYISALERTTPALLSNTWEFIGVAKKHKGVVCSWIKYLQNKGTIKRNVPRTQLAAVLNKELKEFNMGKDGKTFDVFSKSFEDDFKAQLLSLIE